MATERALEVRGLPKLDRFFPDCALGLVELLARWEFGFPDLKKSWFGNTFEYRPPAKTSWLNDNRVEFSGQISTASGTRTQAFERLRRHYGLSVERHGFRELEALLDAIRSELARGVPSIVVFDMALLLEPGRGNGELQPHMVAVTGLDRAGGRLRLMEQVRGDVSLDFSVLETSFHRFQEAGQEVAILRCLRDASVAAPLERRELLVCLRSALRNLRSSEPTLGLAALKQVAEDVARAVAVEEKPFAIPGQWIFSHDRHALRAALPHWRQSGFLDDTRAADLNQALKAAFAHWFQLDMTIERAIHENDVAVMRTASALLFDALPLEERIASIFEQLVGGQDGVEAHAHA